jgi:parvulin-like peptidyl-prolyl isomerase
MMDLQSPVYRNDIAAIVNNEIITTTQLMREVSFFLPKIRAMVKSENEFQREVRKCQEILLNMMIEKILIVTDFNSKGGKMPDTYETKEYEAHIQSRFNGDRVAFAQYLRDNGQSVREFKKDIRERAIVGFVMHSLQDTKPEVSPVQVKEYYDSHIGDYFIDRQVFVKEIDLLKGGRSDDELQEKLAHLLDAIKSGADIQSLIERFSDSPKTANIGWVSVGDVIPELATALERLHVGQFSEPVTLAHKICVLFVSDEKPAKKFTLEEVKKDIEDRLITKYQAEVSANYIKKLKEQAYIKIFL